MKNKSGVEHLAAHPGWRSRKPKKQELVVFVEGGIVQAVIDLNVRRPEKGIEYEVMDYDVLDGNTPEEIKEYWDNRSSKLKAYMKKTLTHEYGLFQRAISWKPEGNENSMPTREENARRLQAEAEAKPKRRETGNALDNEEAMEAIQKQLDLVEWNADTLDNIADIVRSAGYEVRDTDVDT